MSIKLITASQFKPIASAFNYQFPVGERVPIESSFRVVGDARLGESSEALATCAALRLDTVARLLERVGCTGPAALRLSIEALADQTAKLPLSTIGQGFVTDFQRHVAANLPKTKKAGSLTGKLALERI